MNETAHEAFVATLNQGDMFVQTSEAGSWYRGTVARIDRFDEDEEGAGELFANITKPAVGFVVEGPTFRMDWRAGPGDPDFEGEGSAHDVPHDIELWEKVIRLAAGHNGVKR